MWVGINFWGTDEVDVLLFSEIAKLKCKGSTILEILVETSLMLHN